jgi:hypothetical protein
VCLQDVQGKCWGRDWATTLDIQFSVISSNGMADAQTGEEATLATLVLRSQQYKVIMYSCGKVYCNNVWSFSLTCRLMAVRRAKDSVEHLCIRMSTDCLQSAV